MPSSSETRRKFLKTAAIGGVVGTGGIVDMARLPRVSADQARLEPKLVSFDPTIEPLVRLIEESPRDSLLEAVASRIHRGTSYRQVLAALLLAGVRNVQPRPSVGFKFHCVLVVNSCHLASLAGPDEDRWLPIFWALDYFKSSQADEARRSGWHMSAVDEAKVPDATHAEQMFIEAMDNWDVDMADAASAGSARHVGATPAFNLFARYACRDYRSIGHKAIYLANAWRTLQVIGWQHAEPILRSLSFALLNHHGEPNPANSDLDADRPWRSNAQFLKQIPASWIEAKNDDVVPKELCNAFRREGPTEAAESAVDALGNGVGVQSVWDAVFVGAGELLMRQPGIIGLHGLTTANAMHYIWRNTADDLLRRRIVLQACSFNPMFRASAKGRGSLKERSIDQLQELSLAATPDAPDQGAVDDILALISTDRMQAAASTRSFISNGGDARQLIDASRRVLFVKGRDAHDYKFSSAVLEDYGHVSKPWRADFLALSVFNLKGTGHADNPLAERATAALQNGVHGDTP